MKLGKAITVVLSLTLLFSLQGCFSASSELENIKTLVLQKGNDEFSDNNTDVPEESISENEGDNFEFSIGPVGLFFTYGIVYFVSPLDEVDFDIAKDILNNIDGFSISTSSLDSTREMPTQQIISELKIKLSREGFFPFVINRDKDEASLIFVSNGIDENSCAELLVVNFSNAELNLISVEANFTKIMDIFSRFQKVGLGNKFSFNPRNIRRK